MSQPSVAVCIPAYNQGSLLARSVATVLSQSRQPREVWIGDDASTDDTPRIAAELQRKHDCIRYHRHPANLGISGNLSWLMRQPKTDYILRLDADDEIDPRYIGTVGGLLDRYTEAGFAHCGIHEIDLQGNITGSRVLARTVEYLEGDDALKLLVTGYRAAICMFRRTALEAIDFYAGAPRRAEDYFVAIRLADAGYGDAYTREKLASYRFWDANNHWSYTKRMEELDGIVRVYDDALVPAFQKRKWSVEPLTQARMRRSLQESFLLLTPEAKSPVESRRIRALLDRLAGNSPRLRLQLRLIDSGLGPALRSWDSQKLRLRKGLKAIYLRLT